VANDPQYAKAKKALREKLDRWMKETGDPRFSTDDDRWDKYPYFGDMKKSRAKK
jgi:N-sulfoglucosamine sulfohydrolase